MKNGKVRGKISKEQVIEICPDCNKPLTNHENYEKFGGLGRGCWEKRKANKKIVVEGISKMIDEKVPNEKLLAEIAELESFGENFKQVTAEFDALTNAFDGAEDFKKSAKAALKYRVHLERKKDFIFKALLDEKTGFTSGGSIGASQYENSPLAKKYAAIEAKKDKKNG